MHRSTHIGPGISIRNQPIFPGRLKREVMEVLPIGYQDVKIWGVVKNYKRKDGTEN